MLADSRSFQILLQHNKAHGGSHAVLARELQNTPFHVERFHLLTLTITQTLHVNCPLGVISGEPMIKLQRRDLAFSKDINKLARELRLGFLFAYFQR